MRSFVLAFLPFFLFIVSAHGADFPSDIKIDTHAFKGEQVHPDQVVIDKSDRKLYLFSAGIAYASFKIKLGKNPKGHKVKKGDKRTPEGNYFFDWHHPNSKYTKAIHLSYPNDEDRANAEALGVNPGGSIFLHGMPNKLSSWGIFKKIAEKIMNLFDWTDGCIAVKNKDINRLYKEIADGTPVLIRP